MVKKRYEGMEPEIKIIRPGQSQQYSQANMRLVEELTRWLDSKFVIPGTNIRFGIDPLLSMIPILGDFITYLISGALIYTMHNQGASRKVVIKMLMNSTFDAVLGTIPVAGTIFDVFYRANDRNLKLLREHYVEGKHQGSGNGLLILIVVFSVLVVAAAIYGMYKFFEAIF